VGVTTVFSFHTISTSEEFAWNHFESLWPVLLAGAWGFGTSPRCLGEAGQLCGAPKMSTANQIVQICVPSGFR
jgi:hypothetical protein